MKKGLLEDDTWTPEEYIAFGETMPGIALTHDVVIHDGQVLRNAIVADLDSYIDFEKKECFFKEERFITLLERIQKLEAPRLQPPRSLEEIKEFSNNLENYIYKDELLLMNFTLSNIPPESPGLFCDIQDDSSRVEYDFLQLVGYPTEKAEPYYELAPKLILVMNSNSQQKEGAWDFLEYLLSEEFQRGQDTFPVRTECFEQHLARTEDSHGVTVCLRQEDRDFVRYMVEHSYWTWSMMPVDVSVMISEEAEAVWAGDKTAAEAAEIIQNRVNLYLKE